MVLFGLFSAVLHIIIQASTTLCYPYQVQVQVFHKPCCPCPMHFSSNGPGLIQGLLFTSQQTPQCSFQAQGVDLGWCQTFSFLFFVYLYLCVSVMESCLYVFFIVFLYLHLDAVLKLKEWTWVGASYSILSSHKLSNSGNQASQLF